MTNVHHHHIDIKRLNYKYLEMTIAAEFYLVQGYCVCVQSTNHSSIVENNI